jgi:hypothetical protein
LRKHLVYHEPRNAWRSRSIPVEVEFGILFTLDPPWANFCTDRFVNYYFRSLKRRLHGRIAEFPSMWNAKPASENGCNEGILSCTTPLETNWSQELAHTNFHSVTSCHANKSASTATCNHGVAIKTEGKHDRLARQCHPTHARDPRKAWSRDED